MASSEVEVNSVQLKHLGFVRILAINAAVVASNLYDYAKQNIGPLKSAVGKVEDAVTAVVSPIYNNFKGVPDDVLVFLEKHDDQAKLKFEVEKQLHSLKAEFAEIKFEIKKQKEKAKNAEMRTELNKTTTEYLKIFPASS